MFEKDEDYRKARKESKDRITKVIKVWSAREEIIHDEGFQKGAEFGYNKANEWHYVKDGDLPKDGVQVLSEKGHLVIYKGDCFCWFEYSPNADNIKLRKWEEPIAWKEIVLPELPKESE